MMGNKIELCAKWRLKLLMWAVIAFVVANPGELRAEISEKEIIALARKLPQIRVSRSEVAQKEAKLVEVGLFPNPALGWARESSRFGGKDENYEDTWSLEFPLDLSSRRKMRELLMGAEIHLAQAELMQRKSHVIASALYQFYNLIGTQKRLDIQNQALERLREVSRIISKRLEEGSASGYDVARIGIELEIAESELRETSALLDREASDLRAWLLIGDSDSLFVGKFYASAFTDSKLASVPRFIEMQKAAQFKIARAVDHSLWSGIPALSLTGGLRLETDLERSLGYVLGLTIELPLFSRGQDLRAEADAQLAYAQSALQVAERSWSREVARSKAQFQAISMEAKRFEMNTREKIVALERAVESGYREGRRTIVELLDARKARAVVDLRFLELNLLAQKAHVALRAAKGEFE